MAQDANDHTAAGWRWLPIGRHIQNPFAVQEVLRDLHAGEIPYRYRKSEGGAWCDDRPERPWVEVEIDRAAGTVRWPQKVIPAPPHPSDHVIVSGVTPLYPGWPRPLDWPRERIFPALTLYDVEVLVPADAIPADTSPEPACAKFSTGKEWIVAAVERYEDELRNLKGITEVSNYLAVKSQTDSDCPHPLKPRSIQNELRDMKLWPILSQPK
jgi:hypothetical protein